MNISVKRSGGFAGTTENLADLDTARLDPASAKEVDQLVRLIGFFDLPLVVSGGSPGADLFRYEIAIADAKRAHAVAFDDDDTPETEPLRNFVEALLRMKP